MDENHTIKPSKQEITKSINQIFQKYEKQREAKRASRKRARLASTHLENSRNNQHNQIQNAQLQSYPFSFIETSKNDIPLKYRSHNDDALPYKPLQDANESLQQHLSRSRTSSQESIQGIKSPAYSLMKQNSPTKSLLSLKNSKNQVCSVEIGQTYLCQLPNGHWLKAEVIDKRVNPITKIEQFYVHFEGVDRRLDEWIDSARIDTSSERYKSSLQAPIPDETTAADTNIRTRHKKKLHDDIYHIRQSLEEMDPDTRRQEIEHAKLTKVKYIDKLIYADINSAYDMKTWYHSPYPSLDPVTKELISDEKSTRPYELYKFPEIYICAYTLKYFKSRQDLNDYLIVNPVRQPPGRIIYSDIINEDSHGDILHNQESGQNTREIAVYEIDGAQDMMYCQFLCLISKLFLDHKTLYYDVEPFVFYVLCELDDQGAKMVGYFSKEKESPDQNNLACIMVMPPFQRQGYGKFIIDLSYKLSLRQKLIGGPERPLSDLGKVSYRSYWEYTLLSAYKNLKMPTLKELVNNTGIGEVDTIETLKRLNLVTFWRGDYVLRNPLSTIDLAANSFKQPRVLVKEEFLIWRGDKKLKN